MQRAFWDSSALVLLCVQQQATHIAETLSRKYEVVVWWAAPVEICSAFSRLARMGQLSVAGQVQAREVLHRLRVKWREIAPAARVRDHAEQLLDRFPLKAADALQLAAAMAWCGGRPRSRVFLSGDAQLLEAASQLGFRAVAV
jgi:predicted nucleic acid-binding protein